MFDAETTEARVMDLWRLTNTLMLSDPKHLAVNLKGLVEAQEYLAACIGAALLHKREAA